ncbi:unnamed protein product, partial [Staurois parvus]
MGPLCPWPNSKKPMKKVHHTYMNTSDDITKQDLHLHLPLGGTTTKILNQGWNDNSWGPRAIGDHRAPVSLPKLKKAYEKGTRGISWGPLLTPGPRAVPESPNGQSSPVLNYV